MKKISFSFLFLVLVGQIAISQSLSVGTALLEQDKIAAAREVFKSILQKDPKNAGAWFYLGQIYYADENTDSTTLCFKKAVEADADSYFSQIITGKSHLDVNRTKEADKSFNKALKFGKKPELSTIHSLIGDTYMTSRFPNYNKAIEQYTAARDLDTKNVQYFIRLGDALLASGKVGDALGTYEIASNKDKNNPEILMKIARGYYKNGINDVAIEQLENVIKLFPDYSPAYKDLYQVYFHQGLYSKVTPLLEKYVSLVGTDVEQRVRLVKFLCYQAKDYDKAIQEAQVVLEQAPTNYTMYRWLAWAYFEKGEYQKSFDASEVFFKNAGNRALYPSDHNYFAQAANKLAKTDIAIEQYKKVVQLDSSRTDVYDLIAKAYFDGKRWQEAEKAYTEKIAAGASNSQDWYYLGMSQYQQDKNILADSTFAKLTQLQPTYATGWLMRARCNNRLDPDRIQFLAKPYFEKYIELAQADPEKYKKSLIESYNYLGYHAAQSENLAGSATWYEKSIALDPANEEATNALTQIREVLGGQKN